MSKMVKVGMADLNVVKYPDSLTTLGLGSCIGICLYDPTTKVAGMAHIMLPSSQQIKMNQNIAKFADTGIAKLVQDMEKMGARKSRFVAKIAGGAQMFAFQTGSDSLKVGERNAIAVRDILKKMGIPILVDETGGNFGRTIEFYSDTGKLKIKTVGKGEKEL